MALSSYDELIKQVESLKVENGHLRKELQDNSSHLTKLENEASNMKDVLAHLQTSMQEDLDETIPSSLSTPSLDQNLNDDYETDIINDTTSLMVTTKTENHTLKTQSTNESGNTIKHPSGDTEMYSCLQELDKERSRILAYTEREEKERLGYCSQLEKISLQLEKLPLTENYSLQNDMARRQLEYEAKRIRESMQQKLGSTEQIRRRQEARINSIRLIEKEMVRLQQQFYQENHDIELEDFFLPDRNQSVMVDAGTNTSSNSEMFVMKSNGESLENEDRPAVVSNNSKGTKLVTMATQTIDVHRTEPPLSGIGPKSNLSSIYHGTWPMDRGLWNNGSTSMTGSTGSGGMSNNVGGPHDTSSVMSFTSSIGSRRSSNHQLGTKVEMVYSLLSMLGTHDKDDMSRTLLAMSSNQDSCIAMRQSGCLPLLIQLLHGGDKDSALGDTRGSKEARARAAAALHNIVHSHPDDKRGRREARVLRLLEQIRAYCDSLTDSDSGSDDEQKGYSLTSISLDHHPGPAIAALMKLSFDEEHRHAMCQLGGLQAISELIRVDYEVHSNTSNQYSVTLRRYSGMALTNLTFGDGTNKALLCSMKSFMRALVAQLHSPSEDLRQVAASVLRNLSWRADLASKKTLREVGAVTTLMKAAMEAKKESTLKSILSALWNLSAHCSENKSEICGVDGALAFLVSTLTYKSPTKTLAVIENGGGILRNVSSHIAVREDYRAILRRHNCLQILLKHLKSTSLTIVSNACGTLWNLSARNSEDQQALWEMGAVSMLRNLVHSKHKMISMGSSAALKNLLAARPAGMCTSNDNQQRSNVPSLHVRKQRALEAELDQNLSETCENLESPKGSPTHKSESESKFIFGDIHSRFQVLDRPIMHSSLYHNGHLSPQNCQVPRSDSHDSVGSTHSDQSYNRSRGFLNRNGRLPFDKHVITERQRQLSGSPEQHLGDTLSETGRSLLSNKKLMQVMHEVVRHASIDDGEEGGVEYESELTSSACSDHKNIVYSNLTLPLKCEIKDSGSGFTPHYYNRPGSSSLHVEGVRCIPEGEHIMSKSADNSLSPGRNQSRNLIYNKYAKLARRIENFNLDDQESLEQPINFSLKYSDEYSRVSSSSVIPTVKTTANKIIERPVPKIDNYVTEVAQNDNVPNESTRHSPPPQVWQGYNGNTIIHNGTNRSPSNSAREAEETSLEHPPTVYNHYAETDLDNPDQPTNFSLRYPEPADTIDNLVSPEKFYSTNKFPQTYSITSESTSSVLDDAVKTYCTEGTPLNFSNATSMTDLRDNKEKVQDPIGKTNEADEELEENDDKVECIEISSDVPDVCSNSSDVPPELETQAPALEEKVSYDNSNAESGITSPDKVATYYVEDTPVCFSRVSSLSSLHSSLCNDQLENTHSHGENVNLHILEVDEDLNECTKNNVKNKVVDTKLSELEPVKLKEKQKQRAITSNLNAKSTSDRETKTVTFEEAEETPLMFSRCSSLGSLSSFEQHSIYDDRSSVISDISRRASEVVSPSDLPDSPSETMPPSPKHVKATEEELVNSGHGKAKVDLDSLNEEGGPNKSMDIKQKNVFEDAPISFITEGTPLEFSTATSLSSLSIDDEPKITKDFLKVKKLDKLSELNQIPEKTQNNDIDQIEELSEADDNEDDILEACINSAMPNSIKDSKRKYNNSKMYSKNNKSGTLKAISPTSGIPIKTSIFNRGRTGIVAPRMGTSVTQMAICSPAPHIDSTYSESNLIIADSVPKCGKRLIKTVAPLNFETSSETSSVSEDNDNILNECIQSAMPKSKMHSNPRLLLDRISESTNNAEKVKRIVKPTIYDSSSSTHPSKIFGDTSSTQVTSPFIESVRVYATEDTPINFSTSTSLSDLTVDFEDKGDEKNDTNRRAVCDFTNTGQQGGPSSYDSPRTYAVEGTPVTFSRNDSLSSLSCDESTENSKEFPEWQREPALPKPPNRPVILHIHKTSPETPPNKLGVRYQSKKIKTSSEDEHLKHYVVEGTPVCFSRNSSLSSLNSNDHEDKSPVRNGDLIKPKIPEAVEDESYDLSKQYSISSLSVDSAGTDLSEQALLDECISLAMPKSKSSAEKISSKVPKPVNKIKLGRSKLPTKIAKSDRSSVESVAASKIEKPYSIWKNDSLIEVAAVKPISIPKEISESQSGFHESNFNFRKEKTAETDDVDIIEINEDKPCTSLTRERTMLVPQFSTEGLPSESISSPGIIAVQNMKFDVSNNPESEHISGDMSNTPDEEKVVQDTEEKEISPSMKSSVYTTFDDIIPPEDMMNSMISSTCSNLGKMYPTGEMLNSMYSSTYSTLDKIMPPDDMVNSISMMSSTSLTLDKIFPMDEMMNSMQSSTYSTLDKIPPPDGFYDMSASLISSFGSHVERLDELKQPYPFDFYEIPPSSLQSSTCSTLDRVRPPREFYELPSLQNSLHKNFDLDKSDSSSDKTSHLDTFSKQTTDSSLIKDEEIIEVCDEEILHKTEDMNREWTPKRTISVSGNTLIEDIKPEKIHNLEISPEEVQALEENANIVLCSLSEIKRDLSTDTIETLSDDNFIEYETLSLVSTEDASESEKSTSSKTASEQYCEVSCTSSKARPRIVKPVNRDSLKQQKEEPKGPKPIRGRRRSLTRQKSTSSVTNVSGAGRSNSPRAKEPTGAPVKSNRTSALRAASQNQRLNPNSTKPLDNKKVSIKFGSTSNLAKSSNSPKISPKTSRSSSVSKTNYDSKSSHLNKSNESLSSVKFTKGKFSQKNSDDRPKPPIKQGTFTKEKPTQNAPKISPTKTEPKSSNENKPPLPKNKQGDEAVSSRSTPTDDNGVKSQPKSPSQRLSPAESWSKALGTFNFIVDPTQENGILPVDQSHDKQKSDVSVHSVNGHPGEHRKSLGSTSTKSSLGNLKKGNSITNLKNSPSNQNLRRAVSTTKLNGNKKTGSNTSLNKMDGKSSIGWNRSLDNGDSVPTVKKPILGFNKKPVASKIATIWKKDDKPVSGNNSEPKTSPANRKPKQTVLPDGLSRSSTYEKLPNDLSSNSTKVPSQNNLTNHSGTETLNHAMESKRVNSLWRKTGDCSDKMKEKTEDIWVKQDNCSPNTAEVAPHIVHKVSNSKLPTPKTNSNKSKSVTNNKVEAESDPSRPRLIERLNSFIRLDPSETDEFGDKTNGTVTHTTEVKTSPASAIVPPFNYNPNPGKPIQQVPEKHKSFIPTISKCVNPGSIRRRDSYLGSMENDDGSDARSSCMVTTV